MDLNTGASPFAKHEEKLQILLDGYGKNQFVSINYFLLIRLVSQSQKTSEKLPSLVSQKGAIHLRAFLGWLLISTQEIPSLELEAAGSWCSLVAVICSLIFCHFLSYTSYFSCSWIQIYTDFESGIASCCLLKSSLSSKCMSKTTSLPKHCQIF